MVPRVTSKRTVAFLFTPQNMGHLFPAISYFVLLKEVCLSRRLLGRLVCPSCAGNFIVERCGKEGLVFLRNPLLTKSLVVATSR